MISIDQPVVTFVDELLSSALTQSASDIHIEPFSSVYRIRFRCHGILYEKSTLSREFATQVISRLKVIAKLDITEQRAPQDGRLKHQHIDMRLHACPTYCGEKIAIRVLKTTNDLINLSSLGLSQAQQQLFLEKLNLTQGMILVTGPTNSGKTLTLYSALAYLNQSTINITSIEDPVEIELPGINQLTIHPKSGLQFSNMLRAILRQDPNVIMIGEIRDKETADIALHAATTGHLVLSSLHTHSASEALTRLNCLGIKHDDIFSSLRLIIGQRLLRRLCTHCKERDPTVEDHRIHRATGCARCIDGYQGRIGIYECIAIEAKKSIEEYHHSLPITHETLAQSAIQKIFSAQTSLDEVKRVIPHIVNDKMLSEEISWSTCNH